VLQYTCFQSLRFGTDVAILIAKESSIQVKGDRRQDVPIGKKVVMTQSNKQTEEKNTSQAGLICQSLGLLLLVSVAPVAGRAQNLTRVAAPQEHPWAVTTKAKTETKVTGTIQQVTTQHGSAQFVIAGANGPVVADLGQAGGNAAKSFSAGDRVEISGWMRDSNGKNVLVARQISSGDRQVVIRNEHGILIHHMPSASTKLQRVGASFTGGAR